MLPHIVVGGGGHARVLIMALRQLRVDVVGVTDADPARHGESVADVPVLGGDDALADYDRSCVLLVNGIGSTGDATPRRAAFARLRENGFRFASVVHPAAFCEEGGTLGEGVQVMAGAVVQTGTRIGANTIVNTRAAIDHDCLIGAHCHVAPGAVLAGGATVGRGSHIGAGATVIQEIAIGAGALVAAGSVVVEDVCPGVVVAGVPAREIGATIAARRVAGQAAAW